MVKFNRLDSVLIGVGLKLSGIKVDIVVLVPLVIKGVRAGAA